MSSDRALSLIPEHQEDLFTYQGDEYLAKCERSARYHCAECFAFLPTAYARAAWVGRGTFFDDYDGPVCPQGQGCSRS